MIFDLTTCELADAQKADHEPARSVAANSSCTFGIAFTPLATGTFSATFNIGDPDPTGPQKVTLNGTGD